MLALTGSSFHDAFGGPAQSEGPALVVAWDAAVHYPSSTWAGEPVDLHRLGRVYALTLGATTVVAPNGPTCGQKRGPSTTIESIGRLDHDVLDGADVLSPPGNVIPRLSAAAALTAEQHLDRYFLAPHVTATLALMTGTSGSAVPGRRLVWIFSVPSVELVPSIGVPSCGPAAQIVDATSGQALIGEEGQNF